MTQRVGNQKLSEQEASDAEPGTERVSRCVCFDVRFETLLDRNRTSGAGMMEFYQEFGCGSRCSLCMPYIMLMLKEQAPELDVHWSQDFLAKGINPGKVALLEQRLKLERSQTDRTD